MQGSCAGDSKLRSRVQSQSQSSLLPFALPPGMTVLTKWMRHVTPADMRRMRGLPPHPVHTSIMAAMTAVKARRESPEHTALASLASLSTAPQSHAPQSHEERVMFLYSPTHAVLHLEAYLVYRKAQENLVVVDALYSPHPRRGHASQLLNLLETRSGGKTIAMMSTEDSAAFFAKRGYVTPAPFQPATTGLGHLMMTKYVWQEL